MISTRGHHWLRPLTMYPCLHIYNFKKKCEDNILRSNAAQILIHTSQSFEFAECYNTVSPKYLRIMRFKTFLFLLLILFIIDNISAKRISIKIPRLKIGLSRGSSSGKNKYGSSSSRGSSVNNHGSSTNSHGSSTGQTSHQRDKDSTIHFLNAEGGGAKKPTETSSLNHRKPGETVHNTPEVTKGSKQNLNPYAPSAPKEPVTTSYTSDQRHSLWRNRVSNTKGSVTPSSTNSAGNNPHLSTNKPIPIFPPWSFPRGNVKSNVTPPSIGFKKDVYPQTSSHPNSFHQDYSMPMGNPYNLHPSGNTHSSSGPAYYPQQPLLFQQPAVQPFVPGQTVIISGHQDSGSDIGQIFKEALVHGITRAVVNRLINPYPSSVENKPASGATNVTNIIHNNYYINNASGMSTTTNATVGTAGVPITQSNVSINNQGNPNISPNAVNDIIFYKISDNELFTITENLFAKSLNISKYMKLNLQQRTINSNDITDKAMQPLFTIEPELLEYPTIYITRTLYNNYEHHFQRKLNHTKDLRKQEDLLIDTYLNTNVMVSAMQWLADRGFIDADDFERRDVLRSIWFTIFSGSTCGFERIFDSENYGVSIIGVQDWLYFAIKESKGDINYLSYVAKQNLGDTASLLTLNFKMDGLVQSNRTIFVGTMPELEMSLYTICFYVRPNTACPVSLGGTKFVIFTHSFTYFGKEVIDLGFPVF